MGRPKLSDDQRLSARLVVRIRTSDLALLAAEGSPAGVVRGLIKRHLERQQRASSEA